eukprot:TRINITY_DN1814_c0_g1_i6.p1 TRINITY_DN1814_c0_g1~~TRINITY_DN1814_c0_g1_i6.p1  ORF type:complete len:253 (-),score=15.88 TRINITY_DN1814_c0_g1_i6:404-1162(-)
MLSLLKMSVDLFSNLHPIFIPCAFAAGVAVGFVICYKLRNQHLAQKFEQQQYLDNCFDQTKENCNKENVKINDPYDAAARQGYLQWEDYFMSIAFLSAMRSKDPNKQVGACIVSDKNIILGIGYNGFPRGCSDNELPWAKKSHNENILETKYPYVVHAEANALLNKNAASVEGARIYVTMFPCNECAKLLIQAGIKEVVYFEDKQQQSNIGDNNQQAWYQASKTLLKMANVRTRQHGKLGRIVLNPILGKLS